MMKPTTGVSKMIETLVAAETLGYSRLYLDFIHGRVPARAFFAASDPAATAAQLDSRSYDRVAMQQVLAMQNRVFGACDQTLANIDNASDPRAVCVFAGQQAGLFGGPLMTLVKALAVVQAARSLAERLQRPVIPIFWIAADDHDFAEINHVWLLDRKGEPCRVEYRTAPSQPVPAAEITFADRDELARAKENLRECMGTGEFADNLHAAIDSAYAPDVDIVSAFGRFMARITAGTGLVLFSPADAPAKRMAAPLFEAMVKRQGAMKAALSARNTEIERAGYHLQVQKREDAAHLFLNRNGRTPLTASGERYAIGSDHLTERQLRDEIRNHPERLSPDALTRPLLQSHLFPVVMQIGGPAEIAYFAQMNPLFGVFNLPAPVYRARPTVTLMEQRAARTMAEHGLRFADLTGDFEQTINRVLRESFPQDLQRELDELREDVANRVRSFADHALDFDPQLKDMAGQTQGKIDYLLNQLATKVWAAHKRKSGETRERLNRLYNSLYPNRGLQERSIGTAFFLAKHGPSVVRHLLERMLWEETNHQLIYLSESTPQ